MSFHMEIRAPFFLIILPILSHDLWCSYFYVVRRIWDAKCPHLTESGRDFCLWKAQFQTESRIVCIVIALPQLRDLPKNQKVLKELLNTSTWGLLLGLWKVCSVSLWSDDIFEFVYGRNHPILDDLALASNLGEYYLLHKQEL